jgi:valyl-tRNA synthetase
MLDKTYDPAASEQRIYERWERAGSFRCGKRPDAEPFTIVLPPPNVTGSLHMGHALNVTIQDILCRFERLRGRDVLWQPGTDHAGIATQMVVERLLAQENQTDRTTMGREAFVRRVWEWKTVSGGQIAQQLRRLGASCDWSRERFTMDEGLSRAVTKVFVQLYKQGLIYKDKRLVNWDPKLLTAISDLEVQEVEVKGQLWYFRYPIEGSDRFITVATTRPETMLGDTGVAVHPDDERYRDLVGRHAVLPLVGRRIPVVADSYSDPEKGTGAVKITPAHDFNDFEVARRHDLPMVNILAADGTMALRDNPDFVAGVPRSDELVTLIMGLHGADRFEARKIVVDKMTEAGLLEKEEPHVYQVPHGDRSGVVIEPWLTEQWYADAATLALPAIEAVESGRTSFVPKQWEKTYFEWMRNIQPWCISRQLWWGHQIPAWYGPDGTIFVEETEDLALADAARHYGARSNLTRDEDVLDTWFSSALWPFSTLGWPDQTPELERYYPTDVLVTGFDIIFFWVARMMMMGLTFMKEVPFHTVYIHALVRDDKGRKMSKSLGNVIDPISLVEAFGADALRFTLAAMAAQGRDIKLSTSRIEGYRNFGTKLWNAARFLAMQDCRRDPNFDPATVKLTVNRWILGELGRTNREVTEGIASHRYNDAAGALYQFVWNVFCDWHIELIKPVLGGSDATAAAETRKVAAFVLDQILILLHPFMPFMTEELWDKTGALGPARETMLIDARWPSAEGLGDAAAAGEIDWVIKLISEIRSVRAEMNVPAGARIPCVLVGATPEARSRAEAWATEITRLARLDRVEFSDAPAPGAAQIVLEGAIAMLPLSGFVDIAAEHARLGKELDKTAKDMAAISGRLNNPGFVAKAPEEVIEEARERQIALLARKAKIEEALARLSQSG